MGRHQIYKGEPSTKNYYLINDFSGGINTTDVDDVVVDNEFRNLLNMDLSLKGSLQNRKGFGNMFIFNEILRNKGITLGIGRYSLVKIVKNSRNIFEKLEEYSSLDEFLNATKPLDYELHILIVFNNTIRLLKMSKLVGKGLLSDIEVEYKLLYTLNVNASTYKNSLIAIKTVDYGDNVYFSLSDISEDFVGIGNYSIAKETFTVIDNNNCYIPTPYEVCNNNGMTGFNVLASNPLTAIADQGVGIKEVIGLFISKHDVDIPLDKIPQSTFAVNVLHTGTNFHPAEIKLVFKDHLDNEIPHRLLSLSDNGGFFKYVVDALNLTGVNYVTINVVKNDNIKRVNDESELGTNYLGLGQSKAISIREGNTFYVKKISNSAYSLSDFDILSIEKRYNVGFGWTQTTEELWDEFGVIGSEYDIYGKVEDLPKPDALDIYARVLTFDEAGVRYIYLKSTYLDSGASEFSDIDVDTLFASYKSSKYNGSYFELRKGDTSKIYRYDHSNTTFVLEYDNVIVVDDIYDIIPQIGDIIEVGNKSNTFYAMVNKNKNANDFVKINYHKEELINSLLGQYYEVGNTTNAFEVKPINLTNVKIFGIGDRLVYYKGNTIWFSELAQFDYLPNRNFIILPIQSDDEITTINYFRNAYIIFTKEKIFKMSGVFETETFSVDLVNEFVGCIAPNTVRNVNNSLIFMSAQGMYQLTSSNYTDGLENVKKLDKQIKGIIPLTEFVDSLLYNDQYWLMLRDGIDYDTVKYYYNIDTRKGQHPFTLDKWARKPSMIFKNGVNLYTISNGEFFIFDKGYTDLMPSDETNYENYIYTCKIKTINNSFGTPTHDKKFKNIYVKTYSSARILLFFTITIDEYVRLSPKRFEVSINELGEIEYREILDENAGSNLVLDTATLDNFELNFDVLGDNPQEIHKVVISSKGKNISLEIETKSNGGFSIVDIGYLYKLGKVKESK